MVQALALRFDGVMLVFGLVSLGTADFVAFCCAANVLRPFRYRRATPGPSLL
jgi:hypothetical protein